MFIYCTLDILQLYSHIHVINAQLAVEMFPNVTTEPHSLRWVERKKTKTIITVVHTSVPGVVPTCANVPLHPLWTQLQLFSVAGWAGCCTECCDHQPCYPRTQHCTAFHKDSGVEGHLQGRPGDRGNNHTRSEFLQLHKDHRNLQALYLWCPRGSLTFS